MGDDGIQHHTEVRRERRPAPLVVLVAALALVAVVAVLRSDGDRSAEATPTTPSSAPSTTPPGPLAVVHVVADTEDGPRPATTANGPGTGEATAFEAIQATPLVTDGQVVVLVDGGMVLAGRPGGGFRPVGSDAPTSSLVASNEAGHVWVVTPQDDLVLVDLEGADPPVRIPLDGDEVLGPAAFGVVTADRDGAVTWRRPSFDPTPLPMPSGFAGVDAGGDVVLLADTSVSAGNGRFELWSVAEGSLVQSFQVRTLGRPAALATDGSTVALPHAAGWVIRDAITGERRGALPVAPGTPVWIGSGRFAVLVDGTVAVSDGTELSPPWRLRALAERSP